MPPNRARQLVLVGMVFAFTVAALAIGYVLFLRDSYAVLASGLRPTEAAVIVAELEKSSVPYRLRDGGGTILVPESAVDATQLTIARSEAAASGQIGFELFNKSDMGLTNFAQKINYQRALQGELVRTITRMDGVRSARVHLALPERALFRDDRSQPSAAVSVEMKLGAVADPARVAGLQRLVSAAVPELPPEKVVVLDVMGRVISQAGAIVADGAAMRPAALEERSAVERYHGARGRAAVEARLPGVRVALRVLALPLDGGPIADTWSPSGDAAARNYKLRVSVVSASGLRSDEAEAARNAVMQVLTLDPARGDALDFQVGPIDPAVEVPPPSPGIAAPRISPVPPELPPVPAPGQIPGGVLSWLAAAVVLAALIAWRWRVSRPAMLTREEQDSFAQTLRRQLAITGSASDASA